MIGMWISICLLALIFIVVAIGKMEAALIGLLGAVVAIELGLISQNNAFAAVDWNTIFLLIGMMMVIGVTKRSGVFQYLAIKSAKLARGKPVLILVFLSTVTAVLSAFLDNVTTILLVAPVTILIADSLELNALPFLICETMASNIGGTATLIGDPPNIMIGSAAHLSFNDFIINLTPPVFLIFLAFIAFTVLIFRSQLKADPKLIANIMELDEKKSITDRRLTYICLAIFCITVIGFVLHDTLHVQPATIALMSGTLIVFFSKVPIDQIFKEIEWSTIFFFIGLFIVVATVKEQGVFDILSKELFSATRGNLTLMVFAILWLSAFAAAFVGAVPFVATMIPFIHNIGSELPGSGIVLWWALSLGACLGGNGTLTGAAANMVAAGVAKQHGIPMTYRKFFGYGFPTMILSLLIASIYILIRYLI